MRLSIFFIIIGLSAILFFGYMHEKVHQTIYENYDIKSKIEIDFPDFVTIAEEPCPTETCVSLQMQNEIIGYPLLVVLTLIFLGFFFLIVIFEKLLQLAENENI